MAKSGEYGGNQPAIGPQAIAPSATVAKLQAIIAPRDPSASAA